MTTTQQTYRVLHEARTGSKPLTAEVLWSIPRVGAPVPSPDGTWLAVPVTEFSIEKNKGATRLWRVPTDGDTPRPLTAESRTVGDPTFSPDGSQLAFVAKDADDEKAVASPTISGDVPERVAMGTVMGPIAATVAPSLMKLVRMPVMRLVEMQRPVPCRKASGRTPMKPCANQSAAPVLASP